MAGDRANNNTNTNSVNVRFDPQCDANFKAQFESVFAAWINRNRTHSVQTGGRNNWTQTDVTFDDALVLNGLHDTTSRWDHNTVPHVTVQLSNTQFRQERSWYTLHWRPDSGSVVLQQPDTAQSRDARRERARRNKTKRQEKKRQAKDEKDKDTKDKKDDKRDEDGGVGHSQVSAKR